VLVIGSGLAGSSVPALFWGRTQEVDAWLLPLSIRLLISAVVCALVAGCTAPYWPVASVLVVFHSAWLAVHTASWALQLRALPSSVLSVGTAPAGLFLACAGAALNALVAVVRNGRSPLQWNPYSGVAGGRGAALKNKLEAGALLPRRAAEPRSPSAVPLS
jgi:hypothetical protein